MHICLWPNWFRKDPYNGMLPPYVLIIQTRLLPMKSNALFPFRLVLLVLLKRIGELIIERLTTFLKSLKIEVVPFPMKLGHKWLKFIMNKFGIYFQIALLRRNILSVIRSLSIILTPN